MKYGLREANVGDRITIAPYVYGSMKRPYVFRKVAKVTKHCVTDDAGDRWTRCGDKWGESSSYTGDRAGLWEPHDTSENVEVERAWRIMKMRERLSRESTWRDVNETTLRAVCAALDAVAAEAKDAANGEG